MFLDYLVIIFTKYYKRTQIDVEMQREVARFLEQEYMGKKGSKKKRAREKVIK